MFPWERGRLRRRYRELRALVVLSGVLGVVWWADDWTPWHASDLAFAGFSVWLIAVAVFWWPTAPSTWSHVDDDRTGD